MNTFLNQRSPEIRILSKQGRLRPAQWAHGSPGLQAAGTESSPHMRVVGFFFDSYRKTRGKSLLFADRALPVIFAEALVLP